MKKICSLLILVTATSTMTAQNNNIPGNDTAMIHFSVEPAPEWTDLFYRHEGWFGGDGLFSIPLNGIDTSKTGGTDSTLLIFGDSYFGTVKEGKPVPGNVMVNNTIAYITGNDPDKSKLYFQENKGPGGKPQTYFVPQTTTQAKPQLFWLGDGFINKEQNNTLYVFGYKVERTGEGVFDFVEPAVSIIAVKDATAPPFKEQKQIETTLHIKSDAVGEGNLGAGVLVNTQWAGAYNPDGYIYVYGCMSPDKKVVVARVKPADFEHQKEWRFFDGKGWSKNIRDLKAIADGASNELSVTPLRDGRFLMVFQVMGLSDKIGIRVGVSPVGPFSAIREIYTTPEFKEGIWTYNAKAHPNLSKPGELLISYNTITPDFWNDIQKKAHIYRPRFIKLKYKL